MTHLTGDQVQRAVTESVVRESDRWDSEPWIDIRILLNNTPST
jgi:hypothetical protein